MSKDIMVFVEQRDGKIQNVSFELLGKASELSAQTGGKVIAACLGEMMRVHAQELIARGADQVVVMEHHLLAEYMTEPYTKALTAMIRECEPSIVLIGATAIGRDLAPRVSARIHTGLTADCTGLEIDSESSHLLMTRPAFGGNIMATIVCADFRPQMATVRPGVMRAVDADSARKGMVQEFDAGLTDKDANVTIREVVRETKRSRDITEAKYLISGGRGIGGPERFEMLQELANLLGGEVSSSRACVDAGWAEKARQVGQTGKTVRPLLYLACGISGAIQHLAGMEESELIVAINKNNTAPIFDVADVSIVGDVCAIVPKLTTAIRHHIESGTASK